MPATVFHFPIDPVQKGIGLGEICSPNPSAERVYCSAELLVSWRGDGPEIWVRRGCDAECVQRAHGVPVIDRIVVGCEGTEDLGCHVEADPWDWFPCLAHGVIAIARRHGGC